MTSELPQRHGSWDCSLLKLPFVIEKQAFMCLSHWYLTFMLHTKISPKSVFSMFLKNMSDFGPPFLYPSLPSGLLISLEIKSQVLTIIKPLIPSLILSSSLNLLWLFYEFTRNTPALGPLLIVSCAWNTLPTNIHVAGLLISFALWENVSLPERSCLAILLKIRTTSYYSLFFYFALLFFIELITT